MSHVARVAIVDSGIHAGHPHVGAVAGSVFITEHVESEDAIDRLGHGTAVAGAVREKAPDAELYAVKVFDTRLSTSIDVIIRALAWCRRHQMDIVNLSLGTSNPDHRTRFLEALGDDLLVISAAQTLPGSLSGVIGVLPDPECPRDAFYYRDGVFYASPYPRPIPGVPVTANLNGASFAVANMTGFAARSHIPGPPASTLQTLIGQARLPV
ncbi:MAG: hypothetical protein C5B51_10415 [Terriglobia bacterium]|nr:MAG: hypothetical protein C5B51_10415 [Terriglobia bacterium]